jgi:hypothetical protein
MARIDAIAETVPVGEMHRDIAAQQGLALVAQAAQEGGGKAFHAADRRRAQHHAKEEDAEALEAAAQFAPREGEGEAEAGHAPLPPKLLHGRA